MNPSVAILISSYMSGEHGALQLTVESIRKRTEYDNYRILLIDSSPPKSKTRKYLLKLSLPRPPKTWFTLLPFRIKHGEAINNGLIQVGLNIDYVVLLDSDIEILRSDWLTKLTKHISSFLDLGIAFFRKAGNYGDCFRLPSYAPMCCLLNMESYRDFGIQPDDWIESFEDINSYKYKYNFNKPSPYGYESINPKSSKLHFETGSRFTERVIWENPNGYLMYLLSANFIANASQPPDASKFALKHWEGLSAHWNSDEPKMQERRKAIKERLERLRREG